MMMKRYCKYLKYWNDRWYRSPYYLLLLLLLVVSETANIILKDEKCQIFLKILPRKLKIMQSLLVGTYFDRDYLKTIGFELMIMNFGTFHTWKSRFEGFLNVFVLENFDFNVQEIEIVCLFGGQILDNWIIFDNNWNWLTWNWGRNNQNAIETQPKQNTKRKQ